MRGFVLLTEKDGSQLITLIDYAIWIFNIENNNMVQITPDDKEKSRFIVGPWSPDGKGFYLVSDLKREYANLAFYDLDKSKLEWY
jgi:hypothetical protein